MTKYQLICEEDGVQEVIEVFSTRQAAVSAQRSYEQGRAAEGRYFVREVFIGS